MGLTETYDLLGALREPVDLLAGHYGPLSEDQRSFARMIFDGNLKARQWIGEWLNQDHSNMTTEALALHAHKINSGLTMMLGYASLMLTESADSMNPDMVAALTAIMAAGEQAHNAIQATFEAISRDIPET